MVDRLRLVTRLGTTLLLVLVGEALGCGGAPPAARTAPEREPDSGPAWADVFEGTPDLYAVVRPRALQRDGVYGAFWKSLMGVAEARGFTRGASMVEAADGADEIVLGLGRGLDAALVLRGVPASLDPARIRDASGQPLFRLLSDRTKVAEYELVERQPADVGSLFVLPDRTWVGALGDARGRARQAFAVPLRRPAPKADPDALAVVRVAGPLAHVLDRHPLWGPLAKKLTSATFKLMPGKGGVVVALAYADADAAAWGEHKAKEIAVELAKDEKAFGWLKDASVHYEATTVLVRVAVPPRLLEELPRASGADLPP